MPKGPKHAKWKRCVEHVRGKVENPYAVCNKSIGGTKKRKKK